MENTANIIDTVFEDFRKRTIDFDSDWTYLRLSSINDIMFSKICRIISYQLNNKPIEIIRTELIDLVMHSIFGLFQIDLNNNSGERIDKDIVLSVIDKKRIETNKYLESSKDEFIQQVTIEMMRADVKELQELDNNKYIPEQYIAIYFKLIHKIVSFAAQLNEKH